MAQSRKVALVTGAATGIGRAAAVALAEAGFDVVINYSRSEQAARTTAEQAQAKGAKTLLFQCDVSDDRCVRKMLEAAKHEFGRLDALLNNAGTTTDIKAKDFEAMTAEEWDRVFAVKRSRCVPGDARCRASSEGRGRQHRQHRQHRRLRPGPQPLPYAASKAAVVSLTKLLALNLAPEIRVNAVAPGWMEGDWMVRMLKDKYDDLMGRRAKHTPLRRVATPRMWPRS